MKVTGVTPQSPTPLEKRKAMADGLKQAFLSDMLKYAGPRESTGSFSGGTGESQFSSMLNDAYAEAIARRIDMKLIPQERN